MDVNPVLVTIVPEPGNEKAVAKRLLELAEHPSQVKVVTYPSFGYEVPGHLFVLFDGVTSEPAAEPKTFTDGDLDRNALEKRERVRKARKKAADRAEEEK